MTIAEQALNFACRGQSLIGVLSLPDGPPRAAVLVVVGGPQTRVGSHRQFVLLARALASAGIACLRFDYRGMGDSGGVARSFDAVGEDIAAALATLRARLPEATPCYLWGLCDGATAALFHAGGDPGLAGLILLNPWVRTEQGEAAALLSHYYRGRLLSRSFWLKLIRGGLNPRARIREFFANWRSSRSAAPCAADLPSRFAAALRRAGKPVLLILSGRDLTAAEFRDAAQREPLASALAALPVSQYEISEANHTFSSARWRAEVEALTIDWLERASEPR
ncbi:hydrolase 1, exosortase A system-associated [Niveibacterium terrae]|uniref:hydrolase 1, exosortase A system-associated n=1 Tax=Niveibacterium terrae TaxID=3373598 RepID=UPI003A9132B9